MANTLFDIAGEFLQLYELGEDEEAFSDTLDSLNFDLAEKAGGYLAVIDQLEMEADKADEVSKAFAQKAKVRRANIDRIKERLQAAMELIGKDKIPVGNRTIINKKNGGVAPLVITGYVPDNMTKITVAPDNAKIREYLKNHTCEWAHIGERGRHIEVH